MIKDPFLQFTHLHKHIWTGLPPLRPFKSTRDINVHLGIFKFLETWPRIKLIIDLMALATKNLISSNLNKVSQPRHIIIYFYKNIQLQKVCSYFMCELFAVYYC